MNDKPTELEPDTLRLTSRDQVEAAWLAVSITGNAPTATPFLNAMIELMPPSRAPEWQQGARVYLQGGNTYQMRQEIISSLEFVVDNLAEDSEAAKASKGLLAILLEDSSTNTDSPTT